MQNTTRNLTTLAGGVLVGFTITLGLGLGAVDDRPDEIILKATPEATITALDAMDAARAYADAHGLTGCSTPDQADLDDVILTVPADPSSGSAVSLDVTEVTFDEALDSGGQRRNLLACDDEVQ